MPCIRRPKRHKKRHKGVMDMNMHQPMSAHEPMRPMARESAGAARRSTAPVAPAEARQALVREMRGRFEATQQADGHYVFELEADATIPAEYVMLRHFLGEARDLEKERKIGVYLRRIQGEDGGWPLFHDGETDISATIKAYYALKLIGDDIDAPHMARAREAVLSRGGAAKANVFTRFAMALFGQVPWRAVPVMPVEIMHLPEWFFFHMSKVSYWSRTVIAPLLVLYAKRARAENPTGIGIQELFITPPEEEDDYNVNPTGSVVGNMFLRLDKALRWAEPYFPKKTREEAIRKAVDFYTERLNGEDGLGAIFPAMANSVMAYHVLGVPKDDPNYVVARKSIDKLLIDRGEEMYCQPCVSPIWDTCLGAHALMESGADKDDPRLIKALDWLASKQILDCRGDWTVRRPHVRPGGWAFQYANDYYPDVDDTAVVGLALHRCDAGRYAENIERAAEWVVGMQSSNGGWGAFDPENEHYYLNSIPFADHGALLDPPTEDVTARCVSFLAQVDAERYAVPIAAGVEYLKKTQCENGAWFGRWGANYIYGTWSVLCALNAAGEDMEQAYIQRSVAWVKSRQREDGGWGEGLESYEPGREEFCASSTPSQTAWALLALMAAGAVETDEVENGVRYLERTEREGPRWKEAHYTGTGFPRVFYLKYHGYASYFPLWAVARHTDLMRRNDRRVAYGM